MTDLPDFVEPMLARSLGEPFDSDEHLFEIKWDGFRCVAFVESSGLRLLTRRRNDLAPRYPELGCLAELEPGLVLDGEVVRLVDGKPDFYALLEREQVRGDLRVRSAAGRSPTTFVAFDLLYRGGKSRMQRPLRERRAELEELLAERAGPRLVFSDGVQGSGVEFFAQLEALQLEGMLAKRLDGRYLPGRRSESWSKIKRFRELRCAVLGYVPDPERGLKSLILAAPFDGQLRCVGRVGSGIGERMGARLLELLRARERDEPWLACEIDGRWVEPGLYCAVDYLELTKAGTLRGPVFREIFVDPD